MSDNSPVTIDIQPVIPTVTEAPPPAVKKSGACDPSNNPMRRPAWRWDRITYLLQRIGTSRTKKPAAYDDKYILEGMKYLRHYQQLADSVLNDRSTMDVEAAFSTAYVHWPELALAHKMYVSRTFARWAVEALVLAQQTPASIAADLGCPEGVIIAYERYFYDVRDRMTSELFVMDALMSPALKNGSMGGVDYDFFWKGLAYWYGAAVLKATWTMGTMTDDIRKKIQDCMRSMMERNTLRASVARQPTAFNAHDIIDEHLTSKQIEANKPPENGGHSEEAMKTATLISEVVKLSVASGLHIPTHGREPRSAESIRDMAIALVSTMDDPIAAKSIPPPVEEEPVKSAFDRPAGPVVPTVDATKVPVPENLVSARKSIVDRIRSKKGG